MAYLHDEREQDYRGQDEAEHSGRSRDREMTLSTGTILAVFFGLALSWGAFFAFGYNMGSKTKTVSAAAATAGEGAASGEANFANFKPSSGTPAVGANTGTMSPRDSPAVVRNQSPAPAYGTPMTEAGPVKPPPAARPSTIAPPTAEANPATSPSATRPPAPVHAAQAANEATPGPAPTGSFMVQIAAVTHQEDADLEMSSLRRRGYAVVSRTEPNDRFIHIQVGPFGNKKDAEAMRQRLIGDGYLAIVK